MGNASVQKRSHDGVETTLVRRGDLLEASITVHVNGVPDLSWMLAQAWSEVRTLGVTVLRQDVFGVPAQHAAAHRMLRAACGEVDWPVTWLEEGASLGERLTGTHIYAVAGADVRRLTQEGTILGSVYTDGLAEYAHLAGIVSHDLAAPRTRQAGDVLEQLESILGMAGMTFRDVVRTWFYNDHILDWYGAFNTVRTRFFDERKVFEGLVPASTGIGGGNLHGAALVAEALAVRPLDRASPGVSVREVTSPLQCPATDYRSSFSRAVEVAGPDARTLYVSGTASIAPDGATARREDAAGQIALTLDVVAAILEARAMCWQDVSRAIAYIKSGADIAVYDQIVSQRGLPRIPAIVTENDVCRDDLLFELEVDAVKLVDDSADGADTTRTADKPEALHP